jgi:SET domain-containing protein
MVLPSLITGHFESGLCTEVKHCGHKGRGIFAKRSFTKGELIERAQVILVPGDQWLEMEKTALADYYYNWGENGAAIALGFGSLYNHSYSPNTMYIKHYSELVIDYVALCDIAIGSEITINYNGHPLNQQPVWFDASD